MAKKAVRGPQLKLKLARVRQSKKAPQRTLRLHYIEPATKKDGNPFFALRVPADLLRAFKSHAKKKGTEATSLVRAFMSKATGIELESADE